MSARVFNPHIMSEKRRVMRGGGHLDLGESVKVERVERVKKCLFGQVDPEASTLFAQQELESYLEKLSQKWNFDFEAGEPRPSGEDCTYEWEVVNSNKAVPKPYALARLPFLNQHADSNPPIKSGTEGSQSCSSSSSSFISPTRTVQSSNKQTVITDFMKNQKTVRKNLKSKPSVKEEEPATKKARTYTS